MPDLESAQLAALRQKHSSRITPVLEALSGKPLPLLSSGEWAADVESMAMKVLYTQDRVRLENFLAYAFEAKSCMPVNRRFAVQGLVLLAPKFYTADSCEIAPPSDWDEEHSDEELLVDELIGIDWTVRLEDEALIFAYTRNDDNAEIWTRLALPEVKS